MKVQGELKMTSREIVKEALQLSSSERILLVEELWEGIEEQSVGFSEQHREIIRNRIKAEKANPNEVYTWDEVKQYARNETN